MKLFIKIDEKNDEINMQDHKLIKADLNIKVQETLTVKSKKQKSQLYSWKNKNFA